MTRSRARETEGDRPRPTRRRFLKGAVGFGVLLATGSVVALVRSRGYEVTEERARSLVALSPWQFVFAASVARRIAASDRPGDRAVPTPDEVDAAGFVDTYVARMPARFRRDLLRFFAYVEHVAPLGLGLSSRFTRLSASDQDRVLSSLEASSSDRLRGGFEGLKALVFMGYYRDARTWTILGYAGPLIGRPAGGWTR